MKVGHALLRHLLGCFALFLCVHAFSADHHFPPPSLSGDAPLVLSDGHLAFWLDRSGEASLAKALDARARGAFESLPGPLGLGYVEGVAWLHFEVDNLEAWDQFRFLEVRPPYLDRLTLYAQDRTGAWHRLGVQGDRRGASPGAVAYRFPLFPLTLPPGRSAFLLSVESEGPLQGILKLWPEPALQAQAHRDYLALGLRYGLGFLLFSVNMVYLLVFRNAFFAVFVGYLLINGLHWAAMDGLLGQYVLVDQSPWGHPLQLMLACLLTSANWVVFSTILDFRGRYPRFYRVAWGGVGLGVIAALASLAGGYKVLAPLLQAYALLGFIPLVREIGRRWGLPGDERLMAGALAIYPVILSAQFYEVLAVGTYSERSTNLLAASQLWLMMIFNIATGLRGQAYRRRVAEGERQAWAAAQARKAEGEREALRNSLIAALADAVKRPLALVQQSRQALFAASEADGGLGPREGMRLSTLQSAADRLSLLLELAAERDGGMTLELQRDRLSLGELIFQTLLLLPEAERERIHQALPEQDFLLLRGDRRLLSFALLNGLENAVRYSPRGSPVRLTVYAESRDAVAGYTLSLQNDGQPLSDEGCERLFEKYARGPAQGQGGGLGLGLFLVRRIVESHGGWAAFRPGLSEGVELVLWLPKGAP